ncbi:MAG: hypothetical protein QM500_10700 [Methylococcales bacterium]
MLDSLLNVFNKDFVRLNKSEISVDESESDALVKNFKFVNADFFSFNKTILDKTNELFKNNSIDVSLAQGCDGMILFCCNEKWHLFLVELKSSFSATNINKAKDQIQTTFPKLMMALTLVQEMINIDDVAIHGFIVTKPPTSEQKTKIFKKARQNRGYCVEQLCERLILKNDTIILKENSILRKFNLNEQYRFEKMPLHYISSEEGSLDVTKYCNQ